MTDDLLDAIRGAAVMLICAAVVTGCTGNVRFAGPTADAKALTGFLYRPSGPGPFPALVLLHTCGGITFESAWGHWFAAQGYVALLVDSFTARGATNTCAPGSSGPSTSVIAMDALAALDHLQALDGIRHDRIAVVGWSYGASAALAVTAYQQDRLLGVRRPERQFRAAVAFYPWCGSLSTVTMPTLLLLAGADDWAPPTECIAKGARLRRNGAPIHVIAYPRASHGFDQTHLAAGAVSYMGHTLRYDASVAAKAQTDLGDFLRSHLR